MHILAAEHELDIVRIARELAIDHAEPEEILARYKIGSEAWVRLQRDPRFQKILDAELIAWNSASNVHERTRLKAASLIEDFLPEASQRLHDKVESLNGKVELFKALARIAGMGLDPSTGQGQTEKVSVVINLGADQKLRFEKDITPGVAEPSAYVKGREAGFGSPALVFTRGVDSGDQL